MHVNYANNLNQYLKRQRHLHFTFFLTISQYIIKTGRNTCKEFTQNKVLQKRKKSTEQGFGLSVVRFESFAERPFMSILSKKEKKEKQKSREQSSNPTFGTKQK